MSIAFKVLNETMLKVVLEQKAWAFVSVNCLLR